MSVSLNCEGENGPPSGPEATNLLEGVTCSAPRLTAGVAIHVWAGWIAGVACDDESIGWKRAHPAPAFELSPYPPTMAVLPSPDSATDQPWLASPTALVPTSFDPCCVNCPSA